MYGHCGTKGIPSCVFCHSRLLHLFRNQKSDPLINTYKLNINFVIINTCLRISSQSVSAVDTSAFSILWFEHSWKLQMPPVLELGALDVRYCQDYWWSVSRERKCLERLKLLKPRSLVLPWAVVMLPVVRGGGERLGWGIPLEPP